ncbi:MAG TPA: ABC transporter permease [Nocardioides sp.]|nr:ABC transporter permease [Nocardioides sp.]
MTTTLQPGTDGRRPLVPGAFRRQRMPHRRGRRRVFTRRQRIVVSVLNLTAFFVIWQLIATYGNVPTLFLPSVTDVWQALVDLNNEGILWDNLWVSLSIYLIGLAISMVIAIPLGLMIGGIPVLDKALSTYIWALYTLPRIVLMPLLLVWVGINDAARIWIIVLSAVPATLVVIMEGVKTVDNSLLVAGRSFGASRYQLFSKIVMPATVPFIAIGVRMGVTRGLLGLFIGEIFTGVNGIGYILTLAQKTFDSATIYAMLLVFLFFCIAMVSATTWLERKVMEGRRQLD